MTNTIKRLAAGLLALCLAAGTFNAGYGARSGIIITANAESESVTETGQGNEEKEEPNTFNTVEEFNAAEEGTCPTLKLEADIGDNVRITRNDGIIDLNGHRINGYLYMQNMDENCAILVKNGTVRYVDDIPGTNTPYKGPVILMNMKVELTIFCGIRTIYCIGNTTYRSYERERGTFVPADATGYNPIADPIAKTGLVYTGEDQLIIDDSSFNGIFGAEIGDENEKKYYTYYYNLGEQVSDTYEAGTISNGVVDPECSAINLKDAGTYTVYYMWSCDGEYENGAGQKSFEVTIDKAVPTVTPPVAKQLTFNDEKQELVEPASSTFGDVVYSLDGENYSKDIPAMLYAGNFTVWYKVEETDNWYGTEPASVKVHIDHRYTKHEKCDATCTTEGAVQDYWTNEYGHFFSDEKGENEIDSSVVIPATGHDFKKIKPVWTWTKTDNGYDVTAEFKCSLCGDTKTVDALVIPETDKTGTKYHAVAELLDEDTYATDDKIVYRTYTVTVNGGTITEGKKDKYNYDDAVTVTAEDKDTFIGWYEGDELVSDDKTYSFKVQGNTELTAKYDKKPVTEPDTDPEIKHSADDDEPADDKPADDYILGDVNGDGKVNSADIAKAAAHIKGIKTLDDEAKKRADVNIDSKINAVDITKIAAHIKGLKKLVKE